jgi:leader peptidase (prepilin peptidase)/N-methyltransferase
LFSWPVAIILSPIVGSFLGVLIRRLPHGHPVTMVRSVCENCGHPLAAPDLVPLVSYVALHGRCRYCGTSIAPFHVAIEFAALVVAVIVALVDPEPPALWAGCVLGWALLTLGWIDWRHLILPDALTLPLALVGLGTTWRLDPDALTAHAAAAALGYLSFRTLAWSYRRLRGYEGLGEGDAKLMAAAGAWVGLAPLSWVMGGGAFLTLSGVLLHARGIGVATTRLPLGPGLCLALWFVWLLDPVVTQ